MGDSNQVTAVIDTNKGKIRLTIFSEQTPLTSANFINLACRGYYDGLKFHRVIQDFMIQGGCPKGTGAGDPGYKFDDEIAPALHHSKPGILSMANAGPGTNGSQFFITHVPTAWLDGKHTVFGEVAGPDDMNVVNSIQQGDKINSVTIEGDVSGLLELKQEKIAEWNESLDKNFPELKSI